MKAVLQLSGGTVVRPASPPRDSEHSGADQAYGEDQHQNVISTRPALPRLPDRGPRE
jgi:hypothetical protein